MTPEELARLMAERIAETNDRLAALNAARSSGAATTAEWVDAVRVELKNTYIQLAELGKGGRDLMTAQDWGRVGGDLADQYKYLQNFAVEIEGGNLTDGYIESRLAMYGEATKEAYWGSWGSNVDSEAFADLPLLTQQPGDGGTQCLTNCNCTLTTEEDGVHWNLNDGEHCPDCEALANGGPYRLS